MHENRVYYPLFNYLRMILALTVAMYHAHVFEWERAGVLAVEVFFALSGFLIGGILMKMAPAELPRFFFNRSARIWIPYFVAVALLIVASIARDDITNKWVEIVFYKATFSYDFFGPPQLAEYASQMPLAGTGNHFWSICAEEQFYLFAPLLLVLMPARIGRSPWIWLAMYLGQVIINPNGLFAGITLGVLGAIMKERFGAWYTQPRAAWTLAVIVVLSGASMLLHDATFFYSSPIFANSLVLLAAQPGKQDAIGDYLGGLSYPLYLNHWIGLVIANEIYQRFGDPEGTVNHTTGVFFSVLVSAILYQCVDVQVRKYRDRMYTAARGKLAAGVGYILVITGLAVGLALT
jgi:peptidoglycan/LPS O-acetylase OafA/YrhL